ncbi:MAG: cation:proton antiporter [Armatimonadaceae bacterium]
MHDHMTQILLGLFIVYVAAQVGAEVAQRLKLPSVVGEIGVGCLIGPSVLNWVKPSEPLEVLAEIGAVLLLFSVGLETRLGDLRKVGKAAAGVGIAGVIIPFILAAAWAKIAGFDVNRSLFVAAAFVATSAGITARVLHDLGALRRVESRVILGAAVIDDILAMLLLGVVTALQSGSVDITRLLLVLAQAVGFVVIIGFVGSRFMQRRSSVLDAPIHPLSPLTMSLSICLGLASLASFFGLAAIIGAYLAGTVLAESQQRRALERQIQPLMAFLVPFFFVVTGMQVELGEFKSLNAFGLLATITVLAVVSKLAGGWLGALSLGGRSALIVGIGMVPRGEVGIIIAALGEKSGVFGPAMYAQIIAMSLLTSVIAPPLLAILLKKTPEPETAPDIGTDDISNDSLLSAVDSTGYGPPTKPPSH